MDIWNIRASVLTAEDIVREISAALSPIFKDNNFSVYRHTALGGEGVCVDFFQAPPGASNLDIWNSKVFIKVTLDAHESIRPLAGQQLNWLKDQPAPAKLSATMSRSRGIKFRAKSGPPPQVIAYVIQWFKANEEVLKTGGARMAYDRRAGSVDPWKADD